MLAVSGHLAYELLSGVGVPLASRVGVVPAVASYAAASLTAYRAAGRLVPPVGDRRFAVANGVFASMVLTHFTTWPRTTRAGVPWLTECEGLSGPAIGPYNVVLHVSAVAALGGAIENRRAWRWCVVTPVVVVPLLRRQTPTEYRRLLAQAARRPRWWNRRLTVRARDLRCGAFDGSATGTARHRQGAEEADR